MLARDRAVPGENLPEQFVERDFGALDGSGVISIQHDVDVNVSVAGVPKAGDGQIDFLLKTRGEAEQILQPSARHDDVFVQFCEAAGAERGGKFAPDLPDFFTVGVAQSALDEKWFESADDFFNFRQFTANGFFLPVNFNDQMRFANAEAIVLCVVLAST